MLRKLGFAAAICVLAAVTLSVPAPAQAEGGVKVGALNCNSNGGWGFIFGSTRELRCTFTNSNGLVEHYAGHVNKFGVDIGFQRGGVIVWAVFAPTADIGKGALAGTYGGVSGSAAIGAGVGANVLLGGFNKSFTLQPVSLEGMTGFNVAAGVADLKLRYTR